MDKKIVIIVSSFAVALLLGMGVYLQSMEKGGVNADPNTVSLKGLHWHPEIVINVKVVKQTMPANLGVTPLSMAPVHTHEPDGVIHLEFLGIVHTSDIMLGQFFKSWGKDIRSFGTNMKMTVNGTENTEFENYVMQDKDKIVLSFD